MAEERCSRALEASTLFRDISEAHRRAVLEISVSRWYPRGSLLFSEAETARGFYLVTSGRVKVFKISPEGKEQILHIFGAGEIVGEVPVFSGNAFPASAATLEECEILFIPREGFRAVAMDQPQILWNMLGTLARRLREFTVQIERLSLQEVASRLAGVLLDLAESLEGEPGEDVVELDSSKGQLASRIGTTPETLSRTLQKMTRTGVIRMDRKRIDILDRPRLEGLARGGGSLDS